MGGIAALPLQILMYDYSRSLLMRALSRDQDMPESPRKLLDSDGPCGKRYSDSRARGAGVVRLALTF